MTRVNHSWSGIVNFISAGVKLVMYTLNTKTLKRNRKIQRMKNTTKDNYTADVIENDKLVILYFSAPWCGPCKALGPILEQIDAEKSDVLEVVKVNIDEEEELAEAFQVTSIPVMKIMVGGEAKKTIIGAKPKPAIEHELSAFLG